MKHAFALALSLSLAGCNMPSPEFRGIPPKTITIDGSTFEVRQNGNRAEAMRINMQYAPRFGPIRTRAARGMAQATGCKVIAVTGDQALAFGRLKCPNGS